MPRIRCLHNAHGYEATKEATTVATNAAQNLRLLPADWEGYWTEYTLLKGRALRPVCQHRAAGPQSAGECYVLWNTVLGALLKYRVSICI